MLTIRIAAVICALALAPLAGNAWAMGSSSDSQAADTGDYDAGVKAISAQDWTAAIAHFRKVVDKQSDHADALNWLGFAHRKQGDLKTAFDYYGRALAADPRHRGAHEYVGEAYLMAGDLASAEKHLAALDEICTFGCDEYDQLKSAVAAYRQKQGASG